MRLPRMTTRRWMIAVAVVAVAFGAEMMRRRSVSYRGKASRCALEEAQLRAWGESSDRTAAECMKYLREIEAYAEGGGGQFRSRWKPLLDSATRSLTVASAEAEKLHRWAAYWGALRAKYERAALFPWLPVEPDPPIPD